jgi:Holliday junction DNA helicase RuvA
LIAHVRGTVATRDASGVVIEVGGVGLRVSAPTSTLAKLTQGEPAMLHTHLYVREDQLSLFGFTTQEERATFELLLTVSGVGPKAALGILSALSVDQLRAAIANGNADLITVVPGIGKRIASRVILDLRDKLSPRGAKGDLTGILAPAGPDGDVLDALVQVFGYSPQQAAQAVAALPGDAPTVLEDRIRAALRTFTGPRGGDSR